MLKRTVLLGAFALVLAACGGDGDAEAPATSDSGGDSTNATAAPTTEAGGGGEVVNMQAPGQAAASVDGEDYTLDTVGPVGCTVSDSEFNVGFLLGDNEVSLIAGGNASGSEWRGRVDLNIQGPDGVTNYFADFSGGDGGSVAVDGSSMSYSGDWEVLKPGESEPQSAGEGMVSLTCG